MKIKTVPKTAMLDQCHKVLILVCFLLFQDFDYGINDAELDVYLRGYAQ